MDLSYSPQEDAFRAEAHTFFVQELPPTLAAKVKGGRRLSKAEIEGWQAILNRRGWLAPHWPVEYGGAGWSIVERFIFDQEAALAHAPPPIAFGLNMLAPVLVKYGREDQKRHWNADRDQSGSPAPDGQPRYRYRASALCSDQRRLCSLPQRG